MANLGFSFQFPFRWPLQLVGELERLGMVVVYGSTGRLVLCTKRKRLEDGLAHADYVINSIRQRELFHSLDLTPRASWQFLLWMDPVSELNLLSVACASALLFALLCFGRACTSAVENLAS